MINKVYLLQGDNTEQARAETPVAPLLPQNLALPASGKSDCDSRTLSVIYIVWFKLFDFYYEPLLTTINDY